MSVTFPLWIGTVGAVSDFPTVTWFALPDSAWLIRAVEWIASGAILIALGIVIRDGSRTWPWWLIGVGLAISILIDQHRLQPWAYQSLLYAVVFAGMPWRTGRRWIIAIAISVYFYSAAGKLDYQFVHTVGNQMVRTLIGPFGPISEATATKLAFALPLAELTIAVLLAIPRTRRRGGYLAIAMHLTLIGLLGPWGLDHSLGVITWNALLATQSWILFCRIPTPDHSIDRTDQSTIGVLRQSVAAIVVTAALVAPLAERSGYWDHWTSWALYSPHNSRADIQVHQSAIKELPIELHAFLTGDPDGDRWIDLDVDQWSLRQRLVPVYPQARYQLALALDLAKNYQLGQAIRVKVKGVSDRRSGQRHVTFLIGRSDLESELRQYWLVPR
jgi:hypothetical protein